MAANLHGKAPVDDDNQPAISLEDFTSLVADQGTTFTMDLPGVDMTLVLEGNEEKKIPLKNVTAACLLKTGENNCARVPGHRRGRRSAAE